MPKVTFIKNAKVNQNRYKINDSIDVDKKEYAALLKAEVIDPIEDEEFEKEGSDNDLSSLSFEELQKVKNDDLKVYLDKKGIEYDSKAIKDDLIKAILGGG